jgi:ribonuclease HI
MNLEVTVDGSSSYWKRAAVGIVIRDADLGAILLMRHVDLCGYHSNNEAEYEALQIGAHFAKEFQPEKVVFFTDSQLVLQQLKGVYAVRDKQLRELHRKVTGMLRELKATVRWHGRTEGDHRLADRLASYRYKEVLNENHDRIPSDGHRGADPRSDEATRDRITERRGNPVGGAECRTAGRCDGNCAGVSI